MRIPLIIRMLCVDELGGAAIRHLTIDFCSNRSIIPFRYREQVLQLIQNRRLPIDTGKSSFPAINRNVENQ